MNSASNASARTGDAARQLPHGVRDDRQNTDGLRPAHPAIPLDLIDAPTQRLYVVALYLALLAWKIYDWVQLIEDDADSFWLFLKWIAIDFAFLFVLPELRIPWLEFSQPLIVILFFLHAFGDWLLMFNIGVCQVRGLS